jgi:hypothetical protein
MNYRLTATIYPVSDDDPDWWEYRVHLWDRDTDELVDEWDSLCETYNGVPGQRLSFEEAERAVERIRDSVTDGNAADWFDLN